MKEQELPKPIHHWVANSASIVERPPDISPTITTERSLHRAASILYICRLEWPNLSTRICVKIFPNESPETLQRYVNRSAVAEPGIMDAGIRIPRILDFDVGLRAVAMSYIPGTPLEDQVMRSFVSGDRLTTRCASLIEESGRMLAHLHEVEVRDASTLAKPSSNYEYAKTLKALPTSKFVSRCLRGYGENPADFIDSLPSEFWARSENRLLHGDFQLKNILVDDRDRISFIDLEFGLGHPMRDVAQLVVQLERSMRILPLARTERRIRLYEEHLLRGYRAHGNVQLVEDLPFFKLWCTTYSLIQDESHPLLLRKWIEYIQRRRQIDDDSND